MPVTSFWNSKNNLIIKSNIISSGMKRFSDQKA